MNTTSVAHADGARRRRGEQALADLVACAQWLNRDGRYVTVDPAVAEWFSFSTDLDHASPTGTLRWAGADWRSGGADARAVPVFARDLRHSFDPSREATGPASYATLLITGAKYATRVGWRGPNPWYVGLRVVDASTTTLFWRGERDRDIEVEVVARTTSGGEYQIVRTTTGWRTDPEPRSLNAWSAFGARWDDRESLYRSVFAPSFCTLEELRSDRLDSATIARHLSDARILPEQVTINGELWGPKQVMLAQR